MQYRQLGKTGLRVSEIGFGTGNTAGLMLRASPEERIRAVERALELGVNYFDTSPDYGKEAAERNLGQALREVGARPVITTKVEILPGDLDDIAGAVVQSIDASLKRLGLDYVDIVEIHNSPAFKHNPDVPWGWMALSLEDYLGRKGALEGLENARRAGKVGFFGFGAPMESPNRAKLDGVAKYRKLMSELMDIPVVRALFATGKFDLVNVEYNLINPTAGMPKPRGMDVDIDYGDIISLASSYSVGIAIFSPLAKGALTEATLAGVGHHPLSRGTDNATLLAAQATALRFLSRPGEQTLSEATYRFNLMHSGVTTLIGGFSGIEHLEEAAGVSGSNGLTHQEMARVEMVWKANFGLSQEMD